MAEWVIEVEELSKVYRMGAVEVPALRGITLRSCRSMGGGGAAGVLFERQGRAGHLEAPVVG